ncbi:ABC transporter permease subunit [Salinivibrio sp. ES.052]|uniref:ABC transporter permease subunit n=1 Tax=Salinivibrio sp. ES.052 TaxID=1882823 RepID=UPI000927922A|nr:ABC transporter permease subunit [Salinivibrio sp. ES.052]SIN73693.1 phosphate transport system permease protein [Salinivibrio sp. ES.052]
MTHSSPSLTDTNRTRRLKDKLTRQTVRFGGVMVLVTLLLLFFYLLTVVVPLFHQASVTLSERFSVSTLGTPRHIGTDNRNQLVYGLDDKGVLTVARRPHQSSVPETSNTSVPQAKTVLQRPLSKMDNPVMSHVPATAPFMAVESTPGQVSVWQLRFRTHYQDNNAVVPQLSSLTAFGGRVDMDPRAHPLSQLALAMPDSLHGQPIAPILAAVTAENQLVVYRGHHREVASLTSSVDNLALSGDGQRLFVRQQNTLSVWQVDGAALKKRETVNLANVVDSPVVKMGLLAGGRSLILQHQNGAFTQWFDVVKNGIPSLTEVRTFLPGTGAKQIAPELHRKSLATVDETGRLSLVHVTSEKQRHFDKRFTSVPEALAFSPRANALMAVTQSQWQWFSVDNPHPEVSIHSLWQKVWYEGYSSPQYVWQSTSADDTFEAKLSVVPMIFGTLKVALFALVFAVPMAIGAAIYTAYFMSSELRRWVKPTVETIEALPTVIIGFLAGLWLAPWVESHIASVFLLLALTPLVLLGLSVFWRMIPRYVRRRLPDNAQILVIIPALLFIGLLASYLGPWIEQVWLGGDARQFITHELGVGYDQRNALVVGIAMGFAVVPTIFSISEDAIFSVPPHLKNGALALGATHWQTLMRVVLLTASPGIFSAVMMGLGRAVGETMIVLMATGNTPIMDWNLLEGLRTLSANIAVEMPESEVGSSHYRVLFLTAFILFVFTFVFNTLAELVRQRLRDKYSHL